METSLAFKLEEEAINEKKEHIKSRQVCVIFFAGVIIIIFGGILRDFVGLVLMVSSFVGMIFSICYMMFSKALFFHKKLTQEEIKEATVKLINEKIKEANKTIKTNQEWVVKLQEALNDVS